MFQMYGNSLINQHYFLDCAMAGDCVKGYGKGLSGYFAPSALSDTNVFGEERSRAARNSVKMRRLAIKADEQAEKLKKMSKEELLERAVQKKLVSRTDGES